MSDLTFLVAESFIVIAGVLSMTFIGKLAADKSAEIITGVVKGTRVSPAMREGMFALMTPVMTSTEGRWVEAVEFRPGSDIVHHIIASRNAAEAEEPGSTGMLGGMGTAGLVPAWADSVETVITTKTNPMPPIAIAVKPPPINDRTSRMCASSAASARRTGKRLST